MIDQRAMGYVPDVGRSLKGKGFIAVYSLRNGIKIKFFGLTFSIQQEREV
jgi:hypothetical protein